MNVIEGQYSYFKNGTVDRLNDLACRASQKVQTNSIVYLYTQSPIFRINPKNLFMGYKEFDEQANLIRSLNYAYDALGRRIEKVVTDLVVPANNKTRRYVYDGEDILIVLDENNVEISKYTHSTLRIDDALAIDNKQDGKSYFYLKDHLGSIVDIVNDDLSFKQHYAYSSFGELQKVTDISGNDITANPTLEHHFAYTGREYDQESGLYHYRARAYDASIGRFLQIDPHTGYFKIPLTVVNKYGYASNNPMKFVDPSGESILILVGLALGAIKAYSNYKQARDSGFSSEKAWFSALNGALYGFTVGASGGNPAVVFMMSYVHNITNQAIFVGPDNINHGVAITDAVFSATVAYAEGYVGAAFELSGSSGAGTIFASSYGLGIERVINPPSSGIPVKCYEDGSTSENMSHRKSGYKRAGKIDGVEYCYE